jgi:hypothetical protein
MMYFVLWPYEKGLKVYQCNTEQDMLDLVRETDREVLDYIPTENHNYWVDVLIVLKGEVHDPFPRRVVQYDKEQTEHLYKRLGYNSI